MSTSTLLAGLGVGAEPHAGSLLEAPVRRQWLAVDGFITDRLLVTYRAPADRLRALLPEPFVVDELAGFGFLSVCALEVVGMGIRRSPSSLRFDNRELLYRVAVRYRDSATFLTLRSDTASRALALLGGRFSHYGPRYAKIAVDRGHERFELRCEARDGRAHAHVAASLRPISAPSASLFASPAQAADFLVGMSFSAAARGGRVLIQPIEHEPWQPRFVSLAHAQFDFLNEVARHIGVPLEYDNTLHVQGVRQTWKVARWQT